MNAVTTTRSEDGITYVVPHRPMLGDEPPYDLTGATEWERQEIRRHWEKAVCAAHDLIAVGVHFLATLHDPAPRFGVGDGDLTGAGGNVPSYYANRLTIALTALHHVHNGMKHRQAVGE